MTLFGRTALLLFAASCLSAIASPARAQETKAAEPAVPAEPAPATGESVTAPPPACALSTSYKTCTAACLEMFPPAPKVETREELRDRDRLVIHAWWAIGSGAALLIAGGVMGGVALHLNAELEDHCPNGSCPPTYHDDLDRRDRLAVSSTVLIGAGIAASTVGVLILTVFAKPPKEADETAAAALTPYATASSAGAEWTWRF